jgi:hypothetical protein
MVRIFAAGLCLRAVLEEEEEGKQGGQRLGFEVTNPWTSLYSGWGGWLGPLQVIGLSGQGETSRQVSPPLEGTPRFSLSLAAWALEGWCA